MQKVPLTGNQIVIHKMNNYILYNSFLQDLNINKINYIIFGSHCLYLLNKKFNLDVNVDLQTKDLDILIPIKNIEYLKNKYNNKYNFILVVNHKILKNVIYNNQNSKIDLIDNINNSHMKINNNLILNFNYDNFKNYVHKDVLYDCSVNFLNLEAYYGIIKRSGLKKYKNIIQTILNKYPSLKTNVIG